MTQTVDVRRKISAYLTHESSLKDVVVWLSCAALALRDEGDERALEAIRDSQFAIAEYTSGDRSESDRLRLGEMLEAVVEGLYVAGETTWDQFPSTTSFSSCAHTQLEMVSA